MSVRIVNTKLVYSVIIAKFLISAQFRILNYEEVIGIISYKIIQLDTYQTDNNNMRSFDSKPQSNMLSNDQGTL